MWTCPPLNLFNWSNLWKWKEEMRKKNTQCYVVLRGVTEEGLNHVLAVFENLQDADVYCEKCNQTYKETYNDRLFATVQISNYQADV